LKEKKYLKLGVGPPWDLDDDVHDALSLVGEERDIMERRHKLTGLILYI